MLIRFAKNHIFELLMSKNQKDARNYLLNENNHHLYRNAGLPSRTDIPLSVLIFLRLRSYAVPLYLRLCPVLHQLRSYRVLLRFNSCPLLRRLQSSPIVANLLTRLWFSPMLLLLQCPTHLRSCHRCLCPLPGWTN